MSRTIRTPKNREEFLEGLREGLSVGAAARSAGFARRTAFEWKAADPAFAAAWEEAYESGTDAFEDIALGRAREKSDSLLMFLLKSRRPHVYRERVSHQGNDAKPVLIVRKDFAD